MTETTYIQSNKERSAPLLVLLRISSVFLVFRIIFELYRFSVWSKIYKGEGITIRLVRFVDVLEWISLGLQLTLFVVATVLMIRWMDRAYHNLSQLHIKPVKYRQRWAIIGWIVPVANLWIPYAIMSELISHQEEFLISRNYIRPNFSRHSIKGWWWATYVFALVTFGMSFSNALTGYFFAVVSVVFFTISGFLSISMMASMQTLEEGVRDQKDVQLQSPDEDLLDG